jgi:putative PIN family toxin of toxin-antitoxin system
MNVILDTNIFIGAFFENNKDCSLILKEEKNGEFELIMSHEMQEELNRILHSSFKKYEFTASQIEIIFKMLSKALLRTTNIKPSHNFSKCSDKDDNMFFSCAIDGNANYIISKDAHIHALKDDKNPIKNKNKEEIKILYPDEFIMELKKIKLVANFSNH